MVELEAMFGSAKLSPIVEADSDFFSIEDK
jgi:hypothetical protein